MTRQDLHSRAILVNLGISAWSARKYDRKVTEETNRAHGADSDAGRYNKNLMPGDAASYKALTQHVAAARQRHYDQSLAWSDKGWRLLPIANYTKYTDTIRADQHLFDSLLDSFVADYPALRAQASVKLNGLFNDDDYPSNIRKRYDFTLEYSPVPQGGDFRVALSQEEIDAISARTEERVKAAFAEAQNDAVKRLYETLSKIHSRLSMPDGIFRDSLIENAREVADALKRLNLTDDPKLEQYRRQTELLATAEPQTLRDIPEPRIETANRAQEILDAMVGTYGRSVMGGN